MYAIALCCLQHQKNSNVKIVLDEIAACGISLVRDTGVEVRPEGILFLNIA